MANLSNIVSLCNLNNKNFAYKPAECNAENAGQWLDIVIDTTDSFKKKIDLLLVGILWTTAAFDHFLS